MFVQENPDLLFPAFFRGFSLCFACKSTFTKTMEITKKTTKTTQTATDKELSARLAEITETREMTKTLGTQGANHRFPNNGFRNTEQRHFGRFGPLNPEKVRKQIS